MTTASVARCALRRLRVVLVACAFAFALAFALAFAFAFALSGCSKKPVAISSSDAAEAAPATSTSTSADASSGLDPNEALNDPDGGRMASGNTHGKTRDGEVTITGRGGRASHTHGGPGASIGDASFTVENSGSAARLLAVTTVEHVQSRDCMPPITEVRSRPPFVSLSAEGSDAGSSASLTIPAKTTLAVSVHFESVSVYPGFCERNGFRVHFSVDGSTATATSETQILRRDPIRRR